jgi:hypothetical protein
MLIDALSATPRDIERMIRPVGIAFLHMTPAANEWSIAQLIAHLVDIEPKFRARLKRMVEQVHPYEVQLTPDETVYEPNVPVVALLQSFAAERAETTNYLATLKNTDWLRTCNHETYGVTKLHQQVRILIGHDNEHLAQIVNIREKINTI